MFSLGVGLLISTVSQNQFQAFQASAMVAPSILLKRLYLAASRLLKTLV